MGAERTYSLMLKLYMKERVQVEKERILAALTCSRDPYTLKTLVFFKIIFPTTYVQSYIKHCEINNKLRIKQQVFTIANFQTYGIRFKPE